MFTLCMSRGPPPLQDSSQKYSINKKKQIKCGYLLRYKRGFLCKGWCEEWMVLYEDATLAWYTDKSLSRLRGCVRISDAPELLAVGEWTRQVPRKPRFPKACHVGQLLAVGCRMMHDVHWLMGQTSAEISDWMTAISNTLPPPPNVLFDGKRLARVSMANGHANPVRNGCATIIPNGKCPTTVQQNGLVKKPSSACSCDYVQPKGKKRGKFDNDHTILAGVCVDWGQGYGWSPQMAPTPSVAPEISFSADVAVSSAVFCDTTADDYTMATGYDGGDWSAFGDFCF